MADYEAVVRPRGGGAYSPIGTLDTLGLVKSSNSDGRVTINSDGTMAMNTPLSTRYCMQAINLTTGTKMHIIVEFSNDDANNKCAVLLLGSDNNAPALSQYNFRNQAGGSVVVNNIISTNRTVSYLYDTATNGKETFRKRLKLNLEGAWGNYLVMSNCKIIEINFSEA